MGDVLDFLSDLLPPWLATTIVMLAGVGVAIGGIAWQSSLQTKIEACGDPFGDLKQLMQTGANLDCFLWPSRHSGRRTRR